MARWGASLTMLWQELRAALLQIRRDPGFTAVAVLTLAIGIAATVTIFGVIDVLAVPSPALRGSPAHLVHVYGTSQADRSVSPHVPVNSGLSRPA